MAQQKIELRNNTALDIMLAEPGFWFSLPGGAPGPLENLSLKDITLKDVENSPLLNTPVIGLLRTGDVSLFIDDVEIAVIDLDDAFIGGEVFFKRDHIDAFDGTPGVPVVTDGTGHISGGLVSAAAFDHNALSNLDGGTLGEYYHFTLLQHGVLIGGVASDADALHRHDHENMLNVDSGTYRHLSSGQVTTLTTGVNSDSLHLHDYSNLENVPADFPAADHALDPVSGPHTGTLPFLTVADRNHSDLENVVGSVNEVHVSTDEYAALNANAGLDATNFVIGSIDLITRIRVFETTLAALKLITTNRIDGQIVNLRENEALYEWQPASTRLADDDIIIIPDDITHPDPGRWIRTPNPENMSHNTLANIQGAVLNQYHHLSDEQYTDLTGGPAQLADDQHTHAGLGGANTFLALTDTPSSYATYAGRGIVVSDAEDGLRFTDSLGTDAMYTLLGDPTGFENRTESKVDFSDTTPDRTFTIEPVGASFSYFSDGVEYTHTSAQSIQISTSTGDHHIYFDPVDNLLHEITAWDDRLIYGPWVYVSYIYWNDGANRGIIVVDERHGMRMSGVEHAYLHFTRGTAYETGFTIAGYTLDTDNDLAVTFGIGNGTIWDEDIQVDIINGTGNPPDNPFEQVLTDPAQIPVYYKEGVDGYWRKDTANSFPWKNVPAGRVSYNTDPGGGWTQLETPNNAYTDVFIIATTDINEPIISIQGQHTYARLSEALDADALSLLTRGQLPFVEFAPMYRLILNTKSTFGGSTKVKLSYVDDIRSVAIVGAAAVPQDHAGLTNRDLAGSHPATAIETDTSNFDGLLSGTDINVQFALDTLNDVSATVLPTDTINFDTILSALDDTIQKALDTLDDHTHPGTAVSLVTTSFDGILAGADTNVQLAMDTLDDHSSQAVGHPATQVSVDNTGWTGFLSGTTNVQLALDAVDAILASDVPVDNTSWTGFLTGDTDVQECFDDLDTHVHPGSTTWYGMDNADASTLSTAFVQKLRVTFTAPLTGVYEINHSCFLSCSDDGYITSARLQIDDGAVTLSGRTSIHEGGVTLGTTGAIYPDSWANHGGSFFVTLTAGSHDIDYDFKTELATKTAWIKEATISIRQVS